MISLLGAESPLESPQHVKWDPSQLTEEQEEE